MAQTSPSQSPPVSRLVDLIVLILVIAALGVGWQLRQITLFSTELVTVQNLTVLVPSNSLPLGASHSWHREDEFATVTPDGLTVRINVLPAPPIGVEDPLALVTNRALNQGQAYDMYETLDSDRLMLNETAAGVLEYAYVEAPSDAFFSSSLEVIHGFELLVGQGNEVYVVTVEAPESQFDQVERLWAQLQESLRLQGEQS